MANPFDQFDQQTAADQLGRPVIVKGPAPVSPTEQYRPMTQQEKQSYGLPSSTPVVISGSGKPDVISTGNGGNTYRAMTADEKTAAGLDPNMPFYMGSDGIPKLPDGAKGAVAPVDPEQARAHVSQILTSIDQANKLLDNPLASGLPGSLFGHIPGTDAYTLRSLIGDPSDPSNPGQISGDLRQQGIAYLRALNGGSGVGTVARSSQEQAALQSAMSNLRQGLPPDQLKDSLGNVKQIYLRAYARSYGMNPDDPNVQKQFGIDPNYQIGGATPQPKQQPNAGPPPVNVIVPPAQDTAPLEATRTFTENPKLAQYKDQLTAYMNDPSVSNSMLMGYLKKNDIEVGRDIDPTAWQKIMEERSQPQWWTKYNFPVEPKRAEPQSTVQKVLTDIGTSTPGALALGAADAATLGTAPDVVGSLPGFTRTDLIQARDASAANHPGATFAGNLLGSFLPLPGSAEASALARAGKTMGSGAAYGFFGADDPRLSNRLFNAGEGAAIAGVTHGLTDAAGRLTQAGYRGVAQPVESFFGNPETVADKYALNAAARKMPVQNMSQVQAADQAAKSVGVPQPAAVSINRGGQDFLARQANSFPAARQIVDNVAQNTREQIPQQLAGDFNSAIEAAAPRGVNTSDYLNRPVREIASDIQSMAGREYEKGIEPIKGERMQLTPELSDALGAEQIPQAVSDALKTPLDPATRGVLRNFADTLRNGGTPILSVDAARNLATALDRKAVKMADGSPEAVQLGDISSAIRGSIGDQFPEYEPVNTLYASRKRAIQAMYDARDHFFASTPQQQDALAASSRNFTDAANPPEFGAQPQIGPSGFQKPVQSLPSNRQLAMTGAREAAQVKAGENGTATADRIANNVNQSGNNQTVLGNQAQNVQSRAAIRANTADTIDRIASSSPNDKTETWFQLARQAAMTKLTGGGGRYMLAHSAAALPGLSGDDAARVVRLYLNSDSGDQVLKSLTQSYGARRARFIMSRMAAVASAASGVRGFSQKPTQ